MIKVETKCAQHPRYEVKRQPRSDCKTCWKMWQEKTKIPGMSSHALAKKLLKLPDLPVSEHEHGEILTNAKVDTIAANVGLLKCISLIFDTQNFQQEHYD